MPNVEQCSEGDMVVSLTESTIAMLWPAAADAPDPMYRVLNNPLSGERSISLKNGTEMKAYIVTPEQWLFLQEWSKTATDDEGGSYTTQEHLQDKDIVPPNCGLEVDGVIEVSATNTVSGNSYDSNSDTYGAMMGQRAQKMYVFWIPEMEKFGVVRYHYWCF